MSALLVYARGLQDLQDSQYFKGQSGPFTCRFPSDWLFTLRVAEVELETYQCATLKPTLAPAAQLFTLVQDLTRSKSVLNKYLLNT